MLRMKKLIAISTCTLIALFISMTSVFAHLGNWTSHVGFDANGVSEVETNYSSGGNPSEIFEHYVRMHGSNSIVGVRRVAVIMNERASSSFWGQPGKNRYAVVGCEDRVSHSSYFYE